MHFKFKDMYVTNIYFIDLKRVEKRYAIQTRAKKVGMATLMPGKTD